MSDEKIDEEYDPDDAEAWVREQGELGEEYAEEALHQNADYFEEFDSREEVREDFELFCEHAEDEED